MLPVVRTPLAEKDLADALAYLDQFSPPAADRLADGIDSRCELLAKLPEMGRPRDELGPGLRSLVIEKYVLFYRVAKESIQVIRILHGSRDIETIMKENA